jgi:hypothetical protein
VLGERIRDQDGTRVAADLIEGIGRTDRSIQV